VRVETLQGICLGQDAEVVESNSYPKNRKEIYMKYTFGKIGLGLAGTVAAVGLLSVGVHRVSAEIVISLASTSPNPSPLGPNDYKWSYNLTFDGTVNSGDSFIMTGFSGADWLSGPENSVDLDSGSWSFTQVTSQTIPIYKGTTITGSLQNNIQGLEVTYNGTSPITVSSTPVTTTLTLTDQLSSQNIDTYWWKLSDENTSGGNSGDGNAIMPASVNITGQPLPLPAAFWPGLMTLGGMAVVGGLRLRRRAL
jgi:hypothetical protein